MTTGKYHNGVFFLKCLSGSGDGHMVETQVPTETTNGTSQQWKMDTRMFDYL